MTLDGKAVAQKVLDDVRAGVARLKDRSGIVPTLAVVLVGDFAPSKVYVANKKRAADTVGIASQDHIHPEGLDRAALLALLGRLNADPRVHAILLQLPLPAGLDEDDAIAAIAPEKDADGLHPENLGACWPARRPSCRARRPAASRSSTTMAATSRAPRPS